MFDVHLKTRPASRLESARNHPRGSTVGCNIALGHRSEGASAVRDAEPRVPQLAALPRCGQKGCVYPAARVHLFLCIHHLRERREPSLFHSQQPSLVLLDQARFGPGAGDEDLLERSQDRHRLTQERERFLNEAA
jgi:hypothetical protein